MSAAAPAGAGQLGLGGAAGLAAAPRRPTSPMVPFAAACWLAYVVRELARQRSLHTAGLCSRAWSSRPRSLPPSRATCGSTSSTTAFPPPCRRRCVNRRQGRTAADLSARRPRSAGPGGRVAVGARALLQGRMELPPHLGAGHARLPVPREARPGGLGGVGDPADHRATMARNGNALRWRPGVPNWTGFSRNMRPLG